MGKFYIVWNPRRTEGFVTNDPDDALVASTGERLKLGTSAVGECFYETYSDDAEPGDFEFEIQELEIEHAR